MRLITVVLSVLLAVPAVATPFDHRSNPGVAEVAASFAAPPALSSSQITWGWNGVMSREVIARDLDHIQALNLQQAWIEPGRNPEAPYLSAAYFENVKIAIEEAKRRGMYLWFDDDGGYPSGFAGGKFTQERPDLAMKALLAPEIIPVEPGRVFSRELDDQVICAVATNVANGATTVIESNQRHISWSAPQVGRWTVSLVRWEYRSGPTRSANNRSGAKDNEHALMDYLSPEANRLFIAWTFEQYKRAAGAEFGRTLLGFRGDEAAFGFNPWTPGLPAEFQRRKGYDVRPWLPAIAAITIGRGRANATPVTATLDPAQRAYADYCDVWSDLFGENFFGADAAWCAANGITLQHHIEHEEILPQLAIADGDYFKCLGRVQVPGVDVIWHQVWHDVVADFPKLASSAAHLHGHPQAMSETFAAMSGNYPTPDLAECGWILNHQIALGITHFEYMFLPSSAPRTPGAGNAPRRRPPTAVPDAFVQMRGAAPAGYRYLNDPKFPGLALYVNRLTHVLAQGRPAAQIGVFIPSSSFWFGDTAVNRSFLDLVHALLEHQRDVDYIDDDSLAHTLTLEGSALTNASGQSYRAIVVPPTVAISQLAFDRLEALAKAGGTVIFLGGPPRLVAQRTFLAAAAPARPSWGIITRDAAVTPAVLNQLPPSDLVPARPTAGLEYNHRRLRDADIYFLFNAGDSPIDLPVTLACAADAGIAADWDARTGAITAVENATFSGNHATLPLTLPAWATRLIVLRHP